MELTHPSTEALEQHLRTTLSPTDAAYLFQIDAIAQRAQAATDHQHAACTRNIKDLIEKYYHDHQAALEAAPLSQRTGMLHARMKSAQRRGDIAKVPGIKSIRAVVRRLAK